MIVFLFLFALNSDPLCLVHFGDFGNLQVGREESSIVLSPLIHLLPSHLPILTLRKSSFFPVCRRIWKICTLHSKNKYMYINMYALYRQFCV